MRFLCRADASVEIGSGHVVRCATLARRLGDMGHQVEFLCRQLPGHLNRWLDVRGFQVHRLGEGGDRSPTQREDAAACRAALGERRFDWLLVDHYGLGAEWESAMTGVAGRIFVIDDLGRGHDCDLLLDQNYPTPVHALYQTRVPADCEVLLGPAFALVQPEFAAIRATGLRRRRANISRLLVFMSGSDPDNETSKVVMGIAGLNCQNLAVDVVIGANNPRRPEVEAACATLAKVTLHVQTGRMAELMAEADCAIGAAGSSTWERCTLGLPTLVTILAENQAPIAQVMHAAGAHRLLGWHDALTADDYARALLTLDAAALSRMSKAAAKVCDGGGASRVAARLTAVSGC